MRLGVFLPNWVGDVAMATPALRALRKHVGPEGTLVGIMRPYVADVLAGTNWLDEQIVYAKRSPQAEWSPRQAYRRLREARLDCAVLLTNSFRTAWMAWWCGARERIGYVSDLRGLLLTKRLARQESFALGRRPTIDAYLRLAEAAGAAPEPPHIELATTPDDEQAADALWLRLALPPGDRVVVLNSGGAFGAAKHWPAEHFAALARRICSQHELTVLVNCGPAERSIARSIVQAANHPRVTSLADEGHLPLGLTKACIRRARLLVTTDSGPRFFGIAFQKPVITLFGPTDPRMTTTGYAHETCLALSLDCQPCQARICPLAHHRCMRDLSTERVYEAVLPWLTCRTPPPLEPSPTVLSFRIRRSPASEITTV